MDVIICHTTAGFHHHEKAAAVEAVTLVWLNGGTELVRGVELSTYIRLLGVARLLPRGVTLISLPPLRCIVPCVRV